MVTARINNANLMQYDWARKERQAAISKASRAHLRRKQRSAGGAWMVDAAGSDRRSVKFQLHGGFSVRVAWWTIFSTMHQLFSRSGTLEAAMCRYHRIHHAVTFTLLKNIHETRALAAAITKDGVLKATCEHAARLAEEMKESNYK